MSNHYEGILVVESDDQFQIVGTVSCESEALELAEGYKRLASPENDDTEVPPEFFYVHSRNANGFYTHRMLVAA